ncbi:hypothetical protein ZIOFF_053947 [Zingiber officinale]|uniref:diaminopimelate epimerase n=1 Tax=Zingiber officinale TaxID=94328 RepID=A0A8J5FF90_ZINOF|nr:hypothetical protein ZIOFF_053947 [Zingiber officinale]
MAASIYPATSVLPRDRLATARALCLFSPLRSTISLPLLRKYRSCPPAATMSVQAPERSPSVVFLDREESDFLQFVKYQGLGNDFIMVDNRDTSEPKVTPEQAVKLCDRNFGVGADGVIFVLPGVDGTDYTMRIFNSDGSEPEMCGNGVRCFARFIAELENSTGIRSFRIHTGAGLIVPEIQNDGKVKVDMGQPILDPVNIPTKLPANKNGSVVRGELTVDGKAWNVTCVSMGNPHCVTFGTKAGDVLQLDELKLGDIGPLFEHHEVFPARTNTVRHQSMRDSMGINIGIRNSKESDSPVGMGGLMGLTRICSSNLSFTPKNESVGARCSLYSRDPWLKYSQFAGATLACGTGACAVVVAAVLEGHTQRKCVVDLPGGPLEIEWKEEDNHIYMTGPAELVFHGRVFLQQ